MPVNCSLRYSDGTITHKQQYVCFGFLYSFGRTSALFRIPKDIIQKHVTHIDYYYDPPCAKGRTTGKYLAILEQIGVNKVVSHKRMASKVSADLTKFPGQAIVGAFELFRNLQNHPDFVDNVVRLVDSGVSPEVALFIPRLFSWIGTKSITSPHADTTSSDALVAGGEKLFSEETLSNPLGFKPWIRSGDFSGVYKYYARSDTPEPMHLGPVCARKGRRALTDVQRTIMEDMINQDPTYRDKFDYAMSGAVEAYAELDDLVTFAQQTLSLGRPSFEEVLEIAKHYEQTGELL